MAQEKIIRTIIGKVTVDLKTAKEYFDSEEALNELFSILPIKKTGAVKSGESEYDWNVLGYFRELEADSYRDKEFKKPKKLFEAERWSRIYGLENKLTTFIDDLIKLLEEYSFDVIEDHEKYFMVQIPNEDKIYPLPKHLAKIINLYEKFDNVPIGEVLRLKSVETAEDSEVKNALVDISDKSKNEVQLAIESKKKELTEKEDELKRQIAEIKAQMEKEISKMELQMAEKMKPVVTEVEVLTDKLYLFENQIYSVLSFLGFTIEIEKLAKGKRAAVEEPLVIWQKLRYLDEELPKLASIYDVTFEDRKLFEKILIENEIIKDFFLPNEKTITILKTSRTGKRYFYDSHQAKWNKGDKHVWTNYVLSAIDLLHGSKLALLIRDGENIYIAWTDEDRVHVTDDNLFYTDKTVAEVEDVKYKEEREVEKYREEDRGSVALDNIKTVRENYKKRREVTKKPISRMFLKSIIEGLLERKDILRLPIKENVMDGVIGKAKYIKFRSADLALKDTRFGTMDDLKELTSKGEPRVGELICITIRDNGKERGRGWKERTHDVSLAPGITKINLVEYHWKFYATLPITRDMLELKKLRPTDKKETWVLKEDFDLEYHSRHNIEVKQPNKYNYITKTFVDNRTYQSQENKESDDITIWDDAYFLYSMHHIDNYSAQVPDFTEGEIDILLSESCIVKTKEEIPWAERMHLSRKEINERMYDITTYKDLGFTFRPDLTRCKRQIFVSEQKSYSYSENASYANLEVFDSEFINLTLWNTVWLSYAIRNHHTFNNFLGGDFATQLPYIQEMLKVVKEREDEFVHHLIKHYGNETLPNEWQVKLSHWMIEKGYRGFTEFRAKQFAKYLKNSEN